MLPKKIQDGKGAIKETCDYCGSLVQNKYLQRHIDRVHLNIKPSKTVKCTDCDATFETKQHRDRHMNNIHLKVRKKSFDTRVLFRIRIVIQG